VAEFVLDTWALQIAQDCRHAKSLATLTLLEEIKQRHVITIDHGREVLREYSNNTAGNTHAGQWLQLMLSRAGKIYWRHGALSNRHETELINELRFDRADLVFVALASQGPNKILVAEESDYTPQIRNYLATELQVQVLAVEEALEICRGA
jgi:hypothetical protein